MSETVWLALINAMVTVVASIVGITTAYFAFQLKILDLKTKMEDFNAAQGKRTESIKDNMQKIELQGNSMKDQLVEVTKQAALLVGEKIGKDKQIEDQRLVDNKVSEVNSIHIDNVKEINVANKLPPTTK